MFMDWSPQGILFYFAWLLFTVVLPIIGVVVASNKIINPNDGSGLQRKLRTQRSAMITLLATSAPLNLTVLALLNGGGFELLSMGIVFLFVSAGGAIAFLVMLIVAANYGSGTQVAPAGTEELEVKELPKN